MSELERRALETNFAGWKAERAPESADSDAFERYVVELLFKDLDLSDEEISSGLTGGGGDGGIDGFYFFVNRQLMMEETEVPLNIESARLWIVQAKYKNSFEEAPVEKMKDFISDVLDFGKPTDQLTYYSQIVRDLIDAFRLKYEAIIGQPHQFEIEFRYVTRSDHLPSAAAVKRVANITAAVKSHTNAAKTNFEFHGAKEVLEAVRSTPNKTIVLRVKKYFMDDDGSFVCLARLDKFAEFLTDDKSGRIRQYMLVPNVRDHQKASSVNKDIRGTLAASETKEFWWLNNGITILADSADQGAGMLKITSPEIVNGLQTSHEIYNHFMSHKGEDPRTLLVRVILPPDEQTRRRVTKATNNQTPVSPLSLRATEDIHFDIEELFKLHGIYYDRRKGEHKRLKRPVSSIVSMMQLAQAVMSCTAWRPHDARGRPTAALGRGNTYNETFDVNAPRDMFLTCILLDRQASKYLSNRADINRDAKADIRQHLAATLGSMLSKVPRPSKKNISELAPKAKAPIDLDIMADAYNTVYKAYTDNGASGRAAKTLEMTSQLIKALEARFGGGHE